MSRPPPDLDLPDLELGPPVRELPPSEPSTFRVDAIELDIAPRGGSERPRPAPAADLERAHEDLARLDGATVDIAGADVRGLDVAAPLPRRGGSLRPLVGSAPIVPVRTAYEEELAQAPKRFESTFEYDTTFVNQWALPAAFGLALLVHLMGLGVTVFMTVGMWTHELGHAIAAWFTGILAIPLPFVTIAASDDRRWFVILLVAAAWVGLGAHGFRTKNRALVVFAVALAMLQIWMTGIISVGRATQWILFAGMGGEILLSTIGILAFYQRFPYRWDFWRYLVLSTAAVAYVHSLLRWIGVALGIKEMPRGAASGDNAEGDVERLVRTNEFTIPALARTYLVVSLVCGAIMVLAYLYYLRRARLAAQLAARQLGPGG
jgi:hypothetical protein